MLGHCSLLDRDNKKYEHVYLTDNLLSHKVMIFSYFRMESQNPQQVPLLLEKGCLIRPHTIAKIEKRFVQ